MVGAGLTWACTGPTFGTPATPGNPPAPSPDATSPATPAPSTGPGVTATPAPSATTGQSGSSVTSGAGSTSGARGKTNSGAKSPIGTRRQAQVPVQNGIATSQFEARAEGGTAGTTRSAGRAVFASPAAKAKAPRKATGTPSARTAAGDLWSGFEPQARSSVFAAEASATEQGSGAPVTAALAILGLGLVGLVASASVLGLRRRKQAARAHRS